MAWPGGGSPDKLRVGRDNIVRCSCYQAAGVIRQDVPAACLNSGLPMEETEIERAQRHVTEGRRIVAAARARNADLKTRGRDARVAEQNLRLFEKSLEIFEEHLAALLAK